MTDGLRTALAVVDGGDESSVLDFERVQGRSRGWSQVLFAIKLRSQLPTQENDGTMVNPNEINNEYSLRGSWCFSFPKLPFFLPPFLPPQLAEPSHLPPTTVSSSIHHRNLHITNPLTSSQIETSPSASGGTTRVLVSVTRILKHQSPWKARDGRFMERRTTENSAFQLWLR
ncbi:unnamed protein product [Sphenostylis stenocarpa]|uniref:Uncharacterized protein n=1 Tax=Sphenostylis stenocarpa TaxID=92480 RepID=A0AA86W4U4_9FABA|nr:unnamed protein product [Sphenostylis stenocarpa]